MQPSIIALVKYNIFYSNLWDRWFVLIWIE